MTFDRERMKSTAAVLASKGVLIGTSSWKYPGWRGMLYDESRYITRGKFSESRFNRDCLAEYAEVFKTVCVDAAYYKFPDHRYLGGMVSHVPEDFQFGVKVTDEITIKRFTNLPRFGLRAGKPNENFLNANLFTQAFLEQCERSKRTWAFCSLSSQNSIRAITSTAGISLPISTNFSGNCPLADRTARRSGTRISCIPSILPFSNSTASRMSLIPGRICRQ